MGLVTFTTENAKGTLGAFVTRRYEEYMLAAQQGIEVQEFATADSGAALGGARGVPVVFLGHLKVSNVKPKRGVRAPGQPSGPGRDLGPALDLGQAVATNAPLGNVERGVLSSGSVITTSSAECPSESARSPRC